MDSVSAPAEPCVLSHQPQQPAWPPADEATIAQFLNAAQLMGGEFDVVVGNAQVGAASCFSNLTAPRGTDQLKLPAL